MLHDTLYYTPAKSTSSMVPGFDTVQRNSSRRQSIAAFLMATAAWVSFSILLSLLPGASCFARAPAPAPSPVTTKPNARAVASPNDDELAMAERSIREKLPGAPIRHIGKSPISGLFEVMIGGELFYFNRDGTHFIGGGHIIDVATGTNLTETRAAALSRIDIGELPLENAIKAVRGKGERVLFVFSDVDCPYCQRLEETLQRIDNVTIYTFMFPIDKLHPAAHAKQVQIWCAKDRLAAWEDAMRRQKFDPDATTRCLNPVAETQLLGTKLGIRATPTMITAEGKMVMGALPKEQIEAAIEAASAANISRTSSQ